MKDEITVLIPVSPIPSHPDSEVLDTVMASIRERLPDSEIILMFDSPSSSLMHLKARYDEYLQEMLRRINLEMPNVTPLVFDRHMHQSLMTKEALKLVRTPFILWSEQDTTLHDEIPMAGLLEILKDGYANIMRFSHEASVLDVHKDLFLDESPIEILGQPVLRTKQWSGRPHLARTEFYRGIADKYWDDQPRFIEHIMYGHVVAANFDEFRLHMYAPSGTYVRTKHLDGRRKGAENYDPNPS